MTSQWGQLLFRCLCKQTHVRSRRDLVHINSKNPSQNHLQQSKSAPHNNVRTFDLETEVSLKLTLRSTNAQAISLRVARVSSPPSTVTDSRTSPICMEKVKMPVRAPFSSAMARSTSALHSPDDGLSTSRRDASQQVTLFPVFVT